MSPRAWIHRCLLPHWLKDQCPDHEHPHRRRFTAVYRRKRGIVKNVWIASGLVMAAQGSLALVVALVLGTTFLSFVILDETG
ncbi:MAG: SNG1 family protein [Chromatiaceae bacterium]|nr:SNG1 family protein [Chromatiaceae bacterium]